MVESLQTISLYLTIICLILLKIVKYFFGYFFVVCLLHFTVTLCRLTICYMRTYSEVTYQIPVKIGTTFYCTFFLITCNVSYYRSNMLAVQVSITEIFSDITENTLQQVHSTLHTTKYIIIPAIYLWVWIIKDVLLRIYSVCRCYTTHNIF